MIFTYFHNLSKQLHLVIVKVEEEHEMADDHVPQPEVLEEVHDIQEACEHF